MTNDPSPQLEIPENHKPAFAAYAEIRQTGTSPENSVEMAKLSALLRIADALEAIRDHMQEYRY